MRPDDGVVVEGVVGVVARPAGRHLDAFERRDPVCQHGPHLALPQIGVHGQVVRLDGMVDVGFAAGHVGVAVAAHVHARRVDGEGEWLVEWFGCLEDVGEALARFDGEVEAGHLGHPCCSGAGGVHHGSAGDGRTGIEGDADDPSVSLVDVGDGGLVVGDPVALGVGAEGVEHRAAVEVPLVDRVVAAADDVVEVVEGERRSEFVAIQDPSRCAPGRLQLLVRLENAGKRRVGGEIEVAEIVGGELRNIGAVEPRRERADELRRELADPDVDLVGELLSDTAVGRRRRAVLVGRVAFDDEDGAIESGFSRQPPGGRRAHHRSTHDDDVVVLVQLCHGEIPSFTLRCGSSSWIDGAVTGCSPDDGRSLRRPGRVRPGRRTPHHRGAP